MEPQLSPRVPTCPVCLRLLRRCGKVGRPESCGHWFCFPCIYEWSKNVNTCPVDRKKFNNIEVFSKVNGCLLEKVYVSDCSLQDSIEETNDVTYCEVCRECNHEDRLLLCDGCDKGYHLECLTPPLSEVPTGDWYCEACSHIVQSQYHYLSLDSEPESSTFMPSDVEMEHSSGEVSDSDTSVIEMGQMQDDDSDSDTSVIGMRNQKHHHRYHRRQRVIMIEESMSELSVTGESSDEEILATKLRKALQNEAKVSARIPLVRESSTSSSCGFELEERTTVVVEPENSEVEIIDVVNDIEECEELETSNEMFIELDSITSDHHSVDRLDNGEGDGVKSNEKFSCESRKQCGVKDRNRSCSGDTKYGKSSDSRLKLSTTASSSSDGKRARTHSFDILSPSAKNKTRDKDRFTSRNERRRPASKRRLVYTDSGSERSSRQWTSLRDLSPPSKRKDRSLADDDILSRLNRGKESASRSRREMDRRKHGRQAQRDSDREVSGRIVQETSAASNLTNCEEQQQKQRLFSEDSVHSGYVEDSPVRTKGFYSITTKRDQDQQITSRRNESKPMRLQDRSVSSSSSNSQQKQRTSDREIDEQSSSRRRPSDSRSKATRLRDTSNSRSATRRDRSNIKPRRQKRRRRVVLRWPESRSNRNSSRNGFRGRQKRGGKRRKIRPRRGGPKTRSNVPGGRRINDPTYNPPRDIRVSPSNNWTPRTRARTAATHHSVMRDAVRASYQCDSLEEGLRYAREILAQRRGVTPWKSTLSLTPSLSRPPGVSCNTPLSGYTDRTLTPNEGVSILSASETPRSIHVRDSATYQDESGSSLASVSRRANLRVARSRFSSPERIDHTNHTRSRRHGDHTPQNNSTFEDIFGCDRIISACMKSNKTDERLRDEQQERFLNEVSRRRVSIQSASHSKRYLDEVLVTPVKVDVRQNVCEDSSGGGEGVSADLLSRLCQDLNDLQNKRNIIQRDGSIVPIRDEESDRTTPPNYLPTTPPHAMYDHDDTIYPPLYHAHPHPPYVAPHVHAAAADSTTSEGLFNLQRQGQQNMEGRDERRTRFCSSYSRQSSDSFYSPLPLFDDQDPLIAQNAYQQTASNLHTNQSLLSHSSRDQFQFPSNGMNYGGGENSPTSEPKAMVETYLNPFFEDGRISEYQYKRILARATKKVTEGMKVSGFLEAERVRRLVEDFVDGYTTGTSNIQ